MKRSQPTKRLTLETSTIRSLSAPQLAEPRGGAVASITLTIIVVVSVRAGGQCTTTLDTITDGCGPTLSA